MSKEKEKTKASLFSEMLNRSIRDIRADKADIESKRAKIEIDKIVSKAKEQLLAIEIEISDLKDFSNNEKDKVLNILELEYGSWFEKLCLKEQEHRDLMDFYNNILIKNYNKLFGTSLKAYKAV